MQGVSKAIKERSEDIDILAPILPYGGFFGLLNTTSVEQIVRDVIDEVDKALAARERRGDGGAYERLIPDLHEAKFIVGTREAGIREAHWTVCRSLETTPPGLERRAD